MDHSPLFLKLVESVMPRVKEVTAFEASQQAQRPGVILLDVREEKEWIDGHVPGAIHLSRGTVERDIELRVPKLDTPIICYCGGGFRSALAVDNLQKMGYRNVTSMASGFRGWKEQGLPVSTAPEVPPRSPHEKLGGLVHLARMVDKARLYPAGRLPGYNYLLTGFDKTLLEFLCLEGSAFEQIVAMHPTDEGVLNALKERIGPAWPSDHAIVDFNYKLSNRKPDSPDKHASFEQRRVACPPTKRKVETYFDLIDLEEDRLV